MSPGAWIALASLTVILLGALWRFSYQQGQQTQLIETLVANFESFRSEIRAELKTESDTLHARVGSLNDRTSKMEGKIQWIMGRMDMNDEVKT